LNDAGSRVIPNVLISRWVKKLSIICVDTLGPSDWGDCWAYLSVDILVFASATGYMLTSFGFSISI
jgi:hypothetical protein